MFKITVGKNDEVTGVAEKIIDTKAAEILLVIPRFSHLAESDANFRLLKREAAALQKTLTIESVDEKVVKLARAHGIACRNPFFEEGGRRLSDIVTGEKGLRAKIDREEDEEIDPPHVRTITAKPRSHRGKKVRLRVFLWIAGCAAVLAIGLYALINILPRADIKIVRDKNPWSFDGTVFADKAVAVADPVALKIPGQVFEERKNLQLQFPASGKKRMERKAGGTVIIFNAYSSMPQSLVASTRFETPDGKIFRLVAGVTVPGATVTDGKLTPASVEARVTAAEPGESYNIPPVSKFTIPGFSGTPKFTGFTAESKTSMTGGFVGEAAFPTPDDLQKARATAAKTLENSIRMIVGAKLPSDFKLIEGASKFELGKVEVDTDVISDGQFSVSVDGAMTLILFREADLQNMLQNIFLQKVEGVATSTSTNAPLFAAKEEKITYDIPEIRANDVLAIPLHYEAEFARTIDFQQVARQVAGKSENELRAVIFGLSGVKSAKISLWPFWARRVPDNQNRIRLTID